MAADGRGLIEQLAAGQLSLRVPFGTHHILASHLDYEEEELLEPIARLSVQI